MKHLVFSLAFALLIFACAGNDIVTASPNPMSCNANGSTDDVLTVHLGQPVQALSVAYAVYFEGNPVIEPTSIAIADPTWTDFTIPLTLIYLCYPKVAGIATTPDQFGNARLSATTPFTVKIIRPTDAAVLASGEFTVGP